MRFTQGHLRITTGARQGSTSGSPGTLTVRRRRHLAPPRTGMRSPPVSRLIDVAKLFKIIVFPDHGESQSPDYCAA
jgi:hypothetical protein